MSHRVMVMATLAVGLTLGACAHSGASANLDVPKDESIYGLMREGC